MGRIKSLAVLSFFIIQLTSFADDRQESLSLIQNLQDTLEKGSIEEYSTNCRNLIVKTLEKAVQIKSTEDTCAVLHEPIDLLNADLNAINNDTCDSEKEAKLLERLRAEAKVLAQLKGDARHDAASTRYDRNEIEYDIYNDYVFFSGRGIGQIYSANSLFCKDPKEWRRQAQTFKSKVKEEPQNQYDSDGNLIVPISDRGDDEIPTTVIEGH